MLQLISRRSLVDKHMYSLYALSLCSFSLHLIINVSPSLSFLSLPMYPSISLSPLPYFSLTRSFSSSQFIIIIIFNSHCPLNDPCPLTFFRSLTSAARARGGHRRNPGQEGHREGRSLTRVDRRPLTLLRRNRSVEVTMTSSDDIFYFGLLIS